LKNIILISTFCATLFLSARLNAECLRFDSDNYLKIGTTLDKISVKAKRELKLSYAGINRGGLTTISKQELYDFGFKDLRWRKLEGVDLLFDLPSKGEPEISFIAYGLPCDEVISFRELCAGFEETKKPTTWIRSYPEQGVSIGGVLAPVCHVWLRRDVSKEG
jgi:hypothetical protein